MKATERERYDWVMLPIILLVGFLCVILAAGWALRFDPSWELNTNMESRLDPNADFLTRRPGGFIEPVDPSILTQPAWANFIFTPGASYVTRTPLPAATATAFVESTTTAPVTTATIATLITPVPTNTLGYAGWAPSSTPKPKPTDNEDPTPTDTPPPVADLQITNSDGATDYFPDSTRTYTIVVSNPLGPGDINGANVVDSFPAQISSATWTCVGAGGAVCTASGAGNINDLINLPVGSSVTYRANVTIMAGASGDLVNKASVTLPAGYSDPSVPNEATDTDLLITVNPLPPFMAGIHDLPTYNLTSDSTLTLSTSIDVNGDIGVWDLVYYELSAGSGILMDQVVIQISDGYNWYTVLNWGNPSPDANTSLDTNLIGGTEDDNRDIASGLLVDSTGVGIDLDTLPIPPGTYSYIRFTAPAGDTGDGADLDAIIPIIP